MTKSRKNLDFILPTPLRIDEFRKKLLTWFQHHGRHFPWRYESTPTYQKVLAEVLLQRTQAETVASFFDSFVRRFPSWDKLAEATEEDLQEVFKPIGLWRRRAASLKKLADEMARRGGYFPRQREEIEALPGVGQYIANAILMFGFQDAQPLLDASMARVLERYFGPRKLVDIRYDPYLQALAKEVVSGENPVFINWALLDHATLICKQKVPLCNVCPLASKCCFAKQHQLVFEETT